MPMKPKIIIAQVDVSGTAETLPSSTQICPRTQRRDINFLSE